MAAMSFARILAQDSAVAALARSVHERAVPHALLFHGPSGVGKTTTALETARALLCTGAEPPCDGCRACRLSAKIAHPDLLVVVPTEREDGETADDVTSTLLRVRKALDDRLKAEAKKGGVYDIRAGAKATSIGIGAVRWYVQAEIAKKPVESEKRVVVLSDADAMTLSAQNALLKTLEEPPSFAHLLLTTARPDALLDTVRSRCRTVHFGEIPRDVLARELTQRAGVDARNARLAAGLAGGSLPRALRLAKESVSDAREDAMALVAAARTPNPSAAATVARAVAPSGEARDRDRLARLAQLALLYYEDVMLARAGAADEAFAHADLAREIRADATSLDGAALARRVRALEALQEDLARNLMPKLAVAHTILTMSGA